MSCVNLTSNNKYLMKRYILVNIISLLSLFNSDSTNCFTQWKYVLGFQFITFTEYTVYSKIEVKHLSIALNCTVKAPDTVPGPSKTLLL